MTDGYCDDDDVVDVVGVVAAVGIDDAAVAEIIR